MLHHRLLPVAGALAAALVAATPAAAAPPSKAARVATSLTLTQTATYDEPLHYGFEDCFHRYWTRAEARETWKVQTRTRTIGVSRGPGGGSIDYGGRISLDDLASVIPGLNATSTRTRSSSRDSGYDPGDCGPPDSGGFEPTPLVSDCGSLSFDAFVLLELRGGKVTPTVTPHPKETRRDGYSSCILPLPAKARADFNVASQQLPLSDLLDPDQRLHVVLGSQTWTERKDHGTAKVTVRWQLRMKRVGR